VIGDNYVVQIGLETYKATTHCVYTLACKNLLETESGTFAGELAAAVALFIWNDPPTDKRHVAFREQNQTRIEEEIKKPYLRTSEMRELLSGAAYNIGYGRYVAAGGGRLINKFLAYIRSDNIPAKTASDWKINTSLYGRLVELSPTILSPVSSLKSLSLWTPRSNNPNEQEYYQSICALAHRLERN